MEGTLTVSEKTFKKNTPNPLPAQERLRELLDYDPETGVFVWKCKQHGVTRGSVAGVTTNQGYKVICIQYIKYMAHRLAFVWMTGDCPDVVDHINRNRLDNSWSNLRPATIALNSRNSGLRSDNTSGFKGVYWRRQNNKWAAKIEINKKTKSLGYFLTKEEAASAYKKAAEAALDLIQERAK